MIHENLDFGGFAMEEGEKGRLGMEKGLMSGGGRRRDGKGKKGRGGRRRDERRGIFPTLVYSFFFAHRSSPRFGFLS